MLADRVGSISINPIRFKRIDYIKPILSQQMDIPVHGAMMFHTINSLHSGCIFLELMVIIVTFCSSLAPQHRVGHITEEWITY